MALIYILIVFASLLSTCLYAATLATVDTTQIMTTRPVTVPTTIMTLSTGATTTSTSTVFATTAAAAIITTTTSTVIATTSTTAAATTTTILTTQSPNAASLAMVAFVIPILLWIFAVICCYPLFCLFYRFCLKFRIEQTCGWQLGCCTCKKMTESDDTTSTSDDVLASNAAQAQEDRSRVGAPPQYEEALTMDKPKPGDVVRFHNDVDGTLCTFTFSNNNELGDPPIYNFATDELAGNDVLLNEDLAMTDGPPVITQFIDIHNSIVTVNVNTDGAVSPRITVNAAAGSRSTITVNATSVAVEITPEYNVEVEATAEPVIN